MANLEDNIFKQNIPGRWSSLDDQLDVRDEAEGGDASGCDSNDDIPDGDGLKESAKEMTEYDRLLYHSAIPEDVKKGVIAERHRKNGTGIKVNMAKSYIIFHPIEFFFISFSALSCNQSIIYFNFIIIVFFLICARFLSGNISRLCC